ncbi:MAG: transcriptional regulator [Planctomycetes bacterium]|nr:transcriptional regulator [Planctomycetota bacterium]
MNTKKTAAKFASVADMIRDSLPDDPGLADELGEQIAQRQLVRRLANLRNANNVTQGQVAQHLQCAQSRISKLENGVDADVTMADLQAYAKAAGFDLEIVFRSQKITLFDEVKRQALNIQRCFEKLNELAANDEKIAKGVASFHLEALLNLFSIASRSSSRLSEIPGNGDPLISVHEASDDSAGGEQSTGSEQTAKSRSAIRRRRSPRTTAGAATEY